MIKASRPFFDAIKYIFKGKVNASTPDMDYHSQNNKGHGRKECRRCWEQPFLIGSKTTTLSGIN